MISTILLVFAFVFAVIAALFTTGWPWGAVGPPAARAWGVHFGWLALAFYLLSILLGGAVLR